MNSLHGTQLFLAILLILSNGFIIYLLTRNPRKHKIYKFTQQRYSNVRMRAALCIDTKDLIRGSDSVAARRARIAGEPTLAVESHRRLVGLQTGQHLHQHTRCS